MYKALPPSAKKDSNDLQVIESALCKSATVQAKALDKLAELNKELNTSQKGALSEAMRAISDAVEFTVFARSRVNDTRRDRILLNVNSNYRNLSFTTKPANGWLFGSEMESSMKAVETSNRLAQKLIRPSNKNHFLGQRERGRHHTRGRGFHQRGNQRGGYRQSYPQRQNQTSELPPPVKTQRLVV